MDGFVDRLCHPRADVSDEMDRARGSSPESFHSGRAITAILSQLGRRRQMKAAMQVWKWMERSDGITRNVFHYNALINVCEKIRDWRMAMDLLRQMDVDGVTKNEITYSSAISACEKGGNWRTALDLLKTMKDEKIMPTAIAYNAGEVFYIHCTTRQIVSCVHFMLYATHCFTCVNVPCYPPPPPEPPSPLKPYPPARR